VRAKIGFPFQLKAKKGSLSLPSYYYLKPRAMFFKKLIVNTLCLLPWVVSCQRQCPYDFEQPILNLSLETNLAEISGLSPAPNADELAALQDETGQLFFIHKKTGKVTPSVIFQNDGDFEGIEFVGDTLWAMKSNGRLFKIWHYQKTPFEFRPYRIENLRKADNIEGLCLDAQNNRLLLAAKGEKTDLTTARSIYAFDLQNPQLTVTKLFDIKLTDFQAFLQAQKQSKQYAKLTDDYITSVKTVGFEFGPSGIALHPLSGHIYVLSSINKVLLVLNPSGKILDMVKLDKTRFAQPEGICFDKAGTLYIANEAKEGKAANLMAFKMLKSK
jgi:uncharacterized protein YjiK